MHVREVPLIVMNKLVLTPEKINTREFVKQIYPQISTRDLMEYPDEALAIGEVEGFGLKIFEFEAITALSLYNDTRAAILSDDIYESVGSLMAGRRSSGIWSARGGEKVEQTVWLEANKYIHGSEQLDRAAQTYTLLGRLAALGEEALRHNPIDTSSYFENDIRLN